MRAASASSLPKPFCRTRSEQAVAERDTDFLSTVESRDRAASATPEFSEKMSQQRRWRSEIALGILEVID